MTEPHVGYSGNAPVVALDASHAHGFVAAGVEKCWSRFDHCGADMHGVFIVVSEDGDGEHIARTIYAASEDDARQTHQENYADEPIVAVHQQTTPAPHIRRRRRHTEPFGVGGRDGRLHPHHRQRQ